MIGGEDQGIEGNPPKDDDILDAVYGEIVGTDAVIPVSEKRSDFAPWHHPVKQIVRDWQWGDQAKRLVKNHRAGNLREVLRYFTLPGADLLDVKVLAEALAEYGTKVEYFGFDTGYTGSSSGKSVSQGNAIYISTESALRQAGKITDSAEVLPDRLEDIAVVGSQAANRLKQKHTFDIVNIDACDHLAYVPVGRPTSIFDALEAILAHQMRAELPWLLFLTTRAKPDLLGAPAAKLQGAIHKNLEQHAEEFGKKLAKCFDSKLETLTTTISGHWANHSADFLKLYCIGLGKYLLQHYHAQQNLPAKVEFVSAFAYKVSENEPDMLSLAFRIVPSGLKVQQGSAGGAAIIPPIEIDQASAIVEKASNLLDLDKEMVKNPKMQLEAVESMGALLESANFDLAKWKVWLENLPVRPIKVI